MSFEATNVNGSSRRIGRDAKRASQDDGRVKNPTFRFAKNGAPGYPSGIECAVKSVNAKAKVKTQKPKEEAGPSELGMTARSKAPHATTANGAPRPLFVGFLRG